MKKAIVKIFEAKALKKPGGQVYRTIARLPSSISAADLVKASNELGLGHRIENGVIRFFVPS